MTPDTAALLDKAARAIRAARRLSDDGDLDFASVTLKDEWAKIEKKR